MKDFRVVVSPDVVDVLRREHQQIWRLCTAVREAAPDRRSAALAALQQAVHLHLLGERTVAHPAARNISAHGDAIALASQAEGAELEQSLAEVVRRGTGDGGFEARFAAVSTALLDHGAAQEQDEFPLLRHHVTAQRLHMMASEMQDVRTLSVL